MQPKHSAIVAGLTLALSFGAVSAPAPAAAEEPTPGVASDATDIDKGLYTQQSFSGVLRSVQGVSFVNVTAEMKYFTKYESHGNYNQGFSYGDGYNALGYYQFDRRWSLIPFMKQVYNYDSAKYGMLKDAIDRGSEISKRTNFSMICSRKSAVKSSTSYGISMAYATSAASSMSFSEQQV